MQWLLFPQNTKPIAALASFVQHWFCLEGKKIAVSLPAVSVPAVSLSTLCSYWTFQQERTSVVTAQNGDKAHQ